MTKWQLMQAFLTRQPCDIRHSRGTAHGVIEIIQHEDGSGSSFNVYYRRWSDNKIVTVYVRTVD